MSSEGQIIADQDARTLRQSVMDFLNLMFVNIDQSGRTLCITPCAHSAVKGGRIAGRILTSAALEKFDSRIEDQLTDAS